MTQMTINQITKFGLKYFLQGKLQIFLNFLNLLFKNEKKETDMRKMKICLSNFIEKKI